MFKYKKYLKKSKEISQVGLGQNIRERERERDKERREKKSNLSPAISRSFTGRNSVGRELKAAMRDESYAWVPKSQDFSKVKVFLKTKKRRCPGKSR